MIRAVIFDLDGVIVRTDELHYQSWQELADAEGIPFDRRVNERLLGISRLESLAIVLERAPRAYSPADQTALAERKQTRFRELLARLSPADILPGVEELITGLRQRGIKVAVGSSSKNAGTILAHLGLTGRFDVVVDGNDLTRAKPDPEVFLTVARRLGLSPAECLVIEDAQSGIESARRAGTAVLAIGSAEKFAVDVRCVPSLVGVSSDGLLSAFA
jgi:beta-phosphoglucomutase